MTFENFEHIKLFVNNTRLHIRKAGEGKVILLVHGWLGTSYTWRKVAPKLVENGYMVICPDMRGYGDSDKPNNGYDGLNLVEDLRAILKQLQITEKVNVVGWDMGALPTFLYAAKFPEELASITYMDEPLPSVNLHKFTTYNRENHGGYWHFGFNSAIDLPETLILGKEREFWSYLHGLMLYNPAAVSEEDMDEYMRTYANSAGIRGSVGWYRDALETTDQIAEAIENGKITVAVLALGGEYGSSYTHSQLEPYCERIEGGIIPDCGHMIAEEKPEDLLEQLLKFYK
ncbi:alpha/beta hydrolase [Aggregatimonas sangjinii]|uniref:Alpha/beta hydrolase n=1 Tax=Aggregatimonas sangjinii TaxID=2583587 RepID=A0A5B7SPZ5_9FLAO|nr:alpha/beta hydrolase [Aggregatimonas sangjinii]QCW99468.1 alpha/beta hydrolase [Aggregatimonas sangjinii]